MLQIACLTIMLLLVTIIFLIISIQKNNTAFKEKICLLKNIFIDLTYELDNQSKKVKLSDELKSNLRQSSDILNNKILDLNQDLFAVLFSTKENNSK